MRSSSRTRTRTTATAVGAALLSCAVLAGCGGAEAGPTPAPTATSLPLPSPAPLSPGQVVQQQITDAATRYNQVLSSFFANPAGDPAIVDTAATGDAAASLRAQAQQIAAAQLKVTGTSKVVRVTVTDFQPPTAEGATTATAKVCQDVTDFSAVRPDGKSDVDPNRLEQNQSVLVFQNTTPGEPSGWRVSTATNNSSAPCDAA